MRPHGLGGWLNASLGAWLAAGLVVLALRAGPGGDVRVEAGEPAPEVGALHLEVTGAVARPGLVVAPSGARVGDVLALAGGLLPGADPAALNLGRRVGSEEDGLAVPFAGERSPLLDLNLATAAELEALPGVGDVYAARIVEARAARPFTSSDELVERGLVPPSTYRRIRDLVTVR